MPKSLLEQLPEIVAQGRKEAEKILEGLEGRRRVSLQTREVVLPARDSLATDWITQQSRTLQREVFAAGPGSAADRSPAAAKSASPKFSAPGWCATQRKASAGCLPFAAWRIGP